MLQELHISNLAIIEDLHLTLASGLNVFTGQTGAGKSLVLGAIELLLGRRKAGNLLRPGASEGRVTGVFAVGEDQTLDRIAAITDLPRAELDPDEPLLITRKVFESGRTSVAINGRPATNAMLTRIGELLVDMSAAGASVDLGPGGSGNGPGSVVAAGTGGGDFGGSASATAANVSGSVGGATSSGDALSLLKPANQLDILDAFAGNLTLRATFMTAFRRYREIEAALSANQTQRSLRAQQLDLYQFQAAEIDEVDPTPGELEELEARFRLLSNLERVIREGHLAYAALYESDGAIIERLQAMIAVLRDLAEVDRALHEVAVSAEHALASLQDAAFTLNRYLGRQDLDAGELGEVTDRLNRINRLISKYGNRDLQDVIDYRAEIEQEMVKIRSADADVAGLIAEREAVRARMIATASALRERRDAAARRIEPLIEAELHELAMPGTAFRVSMEEMTEVEQYRSSGADSIEFMIRTNPGQPMRPLRQIASGGELSRIMLAVKSVLAPSERTSVLVFDEIDAKIGGRLGTIIGSKLRALSARHQVLVITHLPQIAAFADHHLKIEKFAERDETRTTVRPLTEEPDRVSELAEMLAGRDASATTRAQAQELLQLARSGTLRASQVRDIEASTLSTASDASGRTPAASGVNGSLSAEPENEDTEKSGADVKTRRSSSRKKGGAASEVSSHDGASKTPPKPAPPRSNRRR